MAVLQLDDKQFPLSGDTTRIGAGADADVELPGDATLGVQAVIERSGDRALSIRRAAPQHEVRVNGVLLGAEPTPLIHGDRVEVVGLELRFADETKRGETQYVSHDAIAELVGTRRAGAPRPTAPSGGRLVSLVDGKEYTVPSGGLVIGRDAGCDVVIGRTEVSRRHADVAPTDQGYVVRDMSANGVFVNGDRVQGSQLLARSDVIRVGGEEFRFYADVAPQVAVSPASLDSTLPEPTPPSLDDIVPTAPVVTTSEELQSLEPPIEDARVVLATLEVLNEGLRKGNRFSVRTPLAHVGRGPHNDVRLTDESVSETHAKLQRRDDGWYAVDMNSTNGTYVGGSRIVGERRLEGSPDVRFGGVKLRFTAIDESAAEGDTKGTRTVASVDRLKLTPTLANTIPEPVAAPPSSRRGLMLTVLGAALAAAAFFLLRGRA